VIQLTGEKILLIDDEQPIRKMFRIILSRAGYEIHEADGCLKGVELLRTEPGISAVLLDVIMPGIAGIDCLTKIKAEFGDIPIIMVTGVTNMETNKEVLSMGAFDYIVKPVRKNRLLEVIEKALGKNGE
jgi:DNA-binding NtrC family response regulator